ncbi:hypothetical protein CKO09_07505 [Chromatium weissei]|nr:hypothetical protein [Chromatium weissei]
MHHFARNSVIGDDEDEYVAFTMPEPLCWFCGHCCILSCLLSVWTVPRIKHCSKRGYLTECAVETDDIVLYFPVNFSFAFPAFLLI